MQWNALYQKVNWVGKGEFWRERKQYSVRAMPANVYLMANNIEFLVALLLCNVHTLMAIILCMIKIKSLSCYHQ